MRTNEDFKQLVKDKHKLLQKKKKEKRRRCLIWGSNLLVCIILCTVFLQSGTLTRVLSPIYESDGIYESDAECEEAQSASVSSNSHGDGNGSSIFTSEMGTFSEEEIYPSTSDEFDTCVSETYESNTEEDVGNISPDEPNDSWDTSLDDEIEGEEFPDPVPPDKDELNRDEYNGIFDMDTRAGIGDFAFRLFMNSYGDGKNNLISPTAAIYSLSMLANGANGTTQTEMVSSLCGQDLRRLNCFVYSFRNFFCETIEGALWLESTTKPNDEFLQINKDYYGVEIYDDISYNNINDWFEIKNKELIDTTPYSFGADTKIVAANTVFVENAWKRPLEIMDEKLNFYCFDEEVKQVTAMHGYADGYVETDDCVGIIKRFNFDYDFAAFYPIDGQTLDGLVQKLDYNYFSKEIVYNAIMRPTKLIIPKFEATYEHNLNDTIIKSGINDAFNRDSADFSGISHQNTYITDVLQKVTVSINENGTMNIGEVEMPNDTLNPNAETITFDRPFVYVIYERSSGLPVFIGTVEDFE